MSERDEGEESRAVLTLQKIGRESSQCGWLVRRARRETDPREALCKRLPRFVLVVVFEPDVVAASSSDVFNVGARDDDDVLWELTSPFASRTRESSFDQAPAGDTDGAEQTGG